MHLIGFHRVLIGCAVPDDDPYDDPFDDDMDQGVFLSGLFPLFLPVQIVSHDLAERQLYALTQLSVREPLLFRLPAAAFGPASRQMDEPDSWHLQSTQTVVIQC
jgi:hypothetical protein